MSLIVHIMRKDARYLRYELAIWLLVVLAQAALILFCVGTGALEVARTTIVGVSWILLGILQLAIGGIFAVQLVQDDALVGTVAFWRTRPIARHTLLAAKLASVGIILLGVPFVVELVTYLILGISFTSSFTAASGGLVLRAVLLLLVLAVAVVTSDIARFAMALNLVAVGTIALSWVAVRTTLHAFAVSSDASTLTLQDSRFLVFYLSVMASGLAVVVHQYLSLKTLRSVALISIASVCCVHAIGAWRYDFVSRVERQVDRARFDPELTTLSLDPVPADPPQRIAKGSRQAPVTYLRLYYLVRASGGPTGCFVVPTRTRGTLRFAEGDEIASELSATSLVGSGAHPGAGAERQHAMLSALEPVAWSNLESRAGIGAAVALVEVSETWYREHQGLASTFTGEVTLDAYAFEVTGTMPLRPGAGYRHGPKRADVTSFRARGNGDAEVVLRELSVVQPAGPSWWSTSGQYLLLNQKTREVLVPDASDVREVLSSSWFGQRLAYLTLHQCQLVFKAKPGPTGPLIDAAWLSQAVLVRLEPVSLGSFTRPLKVDNFVLPPLQ